MTQPEAGSSAPTPPEAPKGLTQRALGGMVWTFSGTGVQAAAQLAVMAALGRLLTPAEFGVMGAALVVIAISQIVSQLGVGPALIQRKELERRHIDVAVTLSSGLGLLLGALLWLAAGPIARFYRMPALEPVLHGVAFLFPLDGLNTVGKSLLVRQLRFRMFVVLDVGSYILAYAGVAVWLAWRGYGVWALVIANISQMTLRTVAMYVVTRHPLRPSLEWAASRDLLSYGLGHSLAQIGSVISQQGDNLVVGRWLGASALGIYGRAYNLMVMPATGFERIVNRVLFPVMAQVQDERHRLVGAYERATAIVALVSLPVGAVLWVVAPEFIPLLLGPQWTPVVLPFRLFTVSLLFRMGSKISDACTRAAGAVYSRAVLQGSYAALVVLGALGGMHWGVGGVAVLVSVAMGINWLAMAELSRRVTGLSWRAFLGAHVAGIRLAAAMGLAALLVAEAGRRGGIGNLAVLGLGGVTALVALASALWFRWAPLLGPHGVWAAERVGEMVAARIAGRRRRPTNPDTALAVPEANSK